MEPGESFDQTGFELPPPPQVAPADSGQGELFDDDYSQPDANDGKPVFLSDGAGQSTPTDKFAQLDAPDGADQLLGNVSLRAPGRRLRWEAAHLRLPDAPELERHLHAEARVF